MWQNHPLSPGSHLGNPTQHRTPRVNHPEPQRPDILRLPEHLQLNRKQRTKSPVWQFQLSLEGAGGRRGRQWVPRGLRVPSVTSQMPTMPGLRGRARADTHSSCCLGRREVLGGFSLLFAHGEWG